MIRLLTTLGFTALLVACGTGQPPLTPAAALTGGAVIRGARLAGGPFTPLANPIAVAASGPDLYVVDAARGALFRIEPFSGVMVQFANRPFAPRTRLALGADASLYVLDAPGRRVLRFARDGRLLTTYSVDATVASLTGLALDPARGRILALDSLNRQVISFHPLPPTFEILLPRGDPRYELASLEAIAVARDALYAVDARCACLARLAFDASPLSTFGHGHLVRPERIAADRDGRLFVYDRGDASFKVFQGERLVETIALGRFGLTEATDLAYAEGALYVADGPGAQVRILRVAPPRRSE